MRYQRTTLLAGIAALALVAGSGLASAQDSSKTGEGSHGATPHAMQHMNQTGTPGQSSQGAQAQERGPMSKQGKRAEENSGAQKGQQGKLGENRAQKQEQNRSAQSNEMNKTSPSKESQAGKAVQERNKRATENERPNHRATAQERERMGGNKAAERNRGANTAAEQQNRSGHATNNKNAQRGRTGMEGLQGNATGMNTRLTERQRNQIRSTIIDARGAPRVGNNVGIDVAVGTVIPRGRIHVVPVPETLVRIEPAWRGFLYFVYEDEIVVVNPRDMRIVAVVPA